MDRSGDGSNPLSARWTSSSACSTPRVLRVGMLASLDRDRRDLDVAGPVSPGRPGASTTSRPAPPPP